jgi:hypothetical protein
MTLPTPEHGFEVTFTPQWLDDAQIDTLIEVVEKHGLFCGGNNPCFIELPDGPPSDELTRAVYTDLVSALPVEFFSVRKLYCP